MDPGSPPQSLAQDDDVVTSDQVVPGDIDSFSTLRVWVRVNERWSGDGLILFGLVIVLLIRPVGQGDLSVLFLDSAVVLFILIRDTERLGISAV